MGSMIDTQTLSTATTNAMDGTRITICPAHGMFTNLATGPPVTWAYVTESGSRLEYMFEEGTSY